MVIGPLVGSRGSEVSWSDDDAEPFGPAAEPIVDRDQPALEQDGERPRE